METIINPLTDTGWTLVHHAFLANSTLTDYDPRIGLAYSPFGNAKTVVHAGFGEFHDPIEPAFFHGWYNTGPPLYYNAHPVFRNLSNTFLGHRGAGQTEHHIRLWLQVPSGRPRDLHYGVEPEGRAQLGSGLIASAGYVGSRGNHLLNTVNYDPANYPLNGSGQKVFPACRQPCI